MLEGCQRRLGDMRMGYYSQSEAKSEQLEDRSEPANEKHMCFTRLSDSSAHLPGPHPSFSLRSALAPFQG